MPTIDDAVSRSKPKPPLHQRGGHEQHEERSDSVVGEALPHLREEERRQAARMAEERRDRSVHCSRSGGGCVARDGCRLRLLEDGLVWCSWHVEPRLCTSADRVDCSTTGKIPLRRLRATGLLLLLPGHRRSGGCLIHAAKCAGAFSSSGGTIAVHAASFAG